MAKYPHRVFEMYDFRDEAVCALTPKSASPVIEAKISESWDFELLDVSQSASVTHVGFNKSQNFTDGTTSELRRDFAQLTNKLAIGSRVLLDFTGLNSFSTASIDTLVSFNTHLRHKGSRIVLCCLDPVVRGSFFPAR